MSASPSWLEKAVFYEIYPQTFFDYNNDGIGDLYGVLAKLDYVQSLGFNAIWLNPCFESTFFDAGYDVSDYRKVAKRYGGNKALTALIEACHSRGIHLFLDLVPGHTSLEHPWFKASSQGTANAYSDRYIWCHDYFNVDRDFRWVGGFTQREGGVLVNFFSIQPALNYGFYEIKHPEYEEPITGNGPQGTIHAIEDVIRFWLDQGIDGFRVDMAGWLVKRDPDSLGTQAVWQEIFKDIRPQYPEAAFVSEWNCPKRSMPSGFDMDFLLQDQFTAFNNKLTRDDHPYFRFDEDQASLEGYLADVKTQLGFAAANGHYVSLISGNHDTKRISSWLKPQELAFYYVYMLTMPSVPFFYYGDELGLPYEENLLSVEGGYYRTGTRRPMPWDLAKPNAGFSKNPNVYIPVGKLPQGMSVKDQQDDPHSLLAFLKAMLAFKKEHPALDNDASIAFQPVGPGQSVLAYLRQKDNEKLFIAFNPSALAREVVLPSMGTVLKKQGDVLVTETVLRLYPHSFAILSLA
jgi:glycosidase